MNEPDPQLRSAVALLRLSPYAPELEHLAERIPGIMSSNHQLRPLWERALSPASEGAPVKGLYTREELAVLQQFFEYLYFASDRFAAVAEGRA